MKTPHMSKAIAALAAALAAPALASTFTVGSSGGTFTISRSGAGTNAAETVCYRTVNVSAYAGQHYVARSGTLTFAPNQTTTNVVVSERSPAAAAYKYQTGSTRSYYLELVDAGGFRLAASPNRIMTTGSQFSTSYLNKSVTDLVYFDSTGAIHSGGGNRYRDVALPGNSSYVQVTDGGYKQAVHTIPTGDLFGNSSDLRTYLNGLGCEMYATVYFTQKEEQDGYQYIQILADNVATYDGDDPDGRVNAPSLSLYKACFILSYDPSGSVMTSDHCQFFPHRYDYVDQAAETAAGITRHEFDYDNSHLYQQRFKNSFRASTSGSLVLPLTVSNLSVRFDAAGSGGDTWDFKNMKARLAIVDANAPRPIGVFVTDGPYRRGNTVAVSLAFDEIVAATPSSGFYLDTSWGLLGYVSSSGGGNVLTFAGTIHYSTSDGTTLAINGFTGLDSLTDLAGNAVPLGDWRFPSLSSAIVAPSVDYSIAYDLAGGALPPDEDPNPDAYNYDSDIIALTNPILAGYNFAGWSGTDLNGVVPEVFIGQRRHGDRAYTAHWTPVTYVVRFGPGAADATGSMPDQSFTYDAAPQALSTNAFTRANSTFAGWRGPDGTIYPDRAAVSNLTNAQDAVVLLTATWLPPIPYIDADGAEQICTDYTVLTNAAGDVTYGGGSGWYVVTNAVTISGQLYFRGTAHLILCDGATLAVTNANGNAIEVGNSLTIYGQTNGTGTATANGGTGIYAAYVTINGGTVTAEGDDYGISAFGNAASVTINGGTVTATSGEYGSGIRAPFINLGWTKPTDSIYASSYLGSVDLSQTFTDGNAIYEGNLDGDPSDIAGVTLRPAYSITLPEGVVAGGVVTQIVTTAYALPGTNVTLSAAPGIPIRDVTVNGNALEPVGGVYSFAASADGITVTAAVGIPYIDEDGVERFCADYTVLTNAAGDVEYGGGSGWYVVTNSVTISGYLWFRSHTARLILCDGASLAVTNANGFAIEAAKGLAIYGQTNGTGVFAANGGGSYGISAGGAVTINGGTVTATGVISGIFFHNGSLTINGGTVTANGGEYGDGIHSPHAVTINGGTVTAEGGRNGIYAFGNAASVTINGGTVAAEGGNNGIYAVGSVAINGGTVTANGKYCGIGTLNGSITLGWTNPTDSITASSYDAGLNASSVSVKADQTLTDGIAIYQGEVDPAKIDGKTLRPYFVPYIDADGAERLCTDYTILTNAAGNVRYDGGSGWYVVTTNVNISGRLYFDGAAHLILCDGATLAVTNAYGSAIQAGNLAIYGQTNGTGTVTANGTNGAGISAADFSVTINGGTVTAIGGTDIGGTGINAHYSVTINGGTVTAIGETGIFAEIGSITLGWTNPTDSITASSYYAVDGVSVKDGQRLTDGSDTYMDYIGPALAGVTLRPYISPWDSLQAQLNAGGTVTLTNDVTAADGDASLTVTNAVTLDLNGHTITHNGNGQVLNVVTGGDLTLTNSLAAGSVTGGGDHGVYVGNNAVFRLQGGAIAGNESSYAGGGVFVDRFGTFAMSGGSITNNAVWGGRYSGGGVYVYYGTFTMTGGAISGNTAYYGGGVEVDDGGSFEMSGGAISGNTAYCGGGVDVYYGTFTMTGGAISGNKARDGGGVYVYYGTFTVSGSPVISGSTNSVGAANNVYLPIDKEIAVSNLTAGASIGVTTATVPVTFTAGASEDDSVYFFSDNPGYHVEWDGSKLLLASGEADAIIRANYDEWAQRYGSDALGANEAAFLLNVAPWATPIELRIAGIEVVEGGARVRVAATVGLSAEASAEADGAAVDLSQINGVISLLAGDDLDALAPKSVSGIMYSEGEATIFVPASAGRFVKAVIGRAAPEEE